jgi:hypothetical protein
MQTYTPGAPTRTTSEGESDEISLLDLAVVLAENLRQLALGALLGGLAALGIVYAIAPTYSSKAENLPSQQQQSSAAMAPRSLVALAGAAGGGAAGSCLYTRSRYVYDNLRLAGVPTRGADIDDAFVITANGSVVSKHHGQTGLLSRGKRPASTRSEPGDTIFVPEEIDRTTFVQAGRDWTQTLNQFRLGTAGILLVGG